MRIHSIGAVSRAIKLAALMETYQALQNQREAQSSGNVGATPSLPAYAPSKPSSAAILNPARRAFWAMKKAQRVNSGSDRTRLADARSDHGGEAEVPLWQRMQFGERNSGPIPGNNHAEVPVQPERAHVTRLGQEIRDEARHAPSQSPELPSMKVGADMSARMALRGRGSLLYWLRLQSPAVDAFAPA